MLLLVVLYVNGFIIPWWIWALIGAREMFRFIAIAVQVSDKL